MWAGHPAYGGHVGKPFIYGRENRYYFQRRPRETEREELRNPLTEPELSKLITEIQQGKHQTVVMTERELANHQLIRIVTAASAAGSVTTEIDASNNELDDNVVRDLVPILSNNNKLKVLNLAYNRITNDAMPYFRQILAVNKKINCINLFQNQINEPNLLSLQGLLNVNSSDEKKRKEKEEIEKAEIQKELAKRGAYQDILSQLAEEGVVRDVARHVLEYFNEANIPTARQAVEDALYPRAVSSQQSASALPVDARIASIHEGYQHLQVTAIDSLGSKPPEVLSFSNIAIEARVVVDDDKVRGDKVNTGKTKWCRRNCIIL